MCGIIGYAGEQKPAPILVEGLRTLEYRGYDSAGVAVQTEKGLKIVKAEGRLDVLAEKLARGEELIGPSGIGHTRWATHGAPSDKNSHPHATDHLALVHNGIIENYAELSRYLKGLGYSFVSETDTEVAAKLIDSCYLDKKDPVAAIFTATALMRGSYAFGILFADFPGKIFAIRKDSPLIVASSKEGGFIASDIPAILSHADEYYRLEENVVAVVTESDASFYNVAGQCVTQPLEKVTWSVEQAQKGGYPHFMIKEIHEEPEALRKTLQSRIWDGLPRFGIPALDTNFIGQFHAIHIVACGTAMHAGLVGKTMIEKYARVPVDVDVASEFRYRDPILHKDDLVILLSQSGETADTLAALRHAKSEGVYTLAIVNVIGSSVAREADSVLYTWAGPEIAVASTKAYSVQCALLYLLAIRIALVVGQMTVKTARLLCDELLREVPHAVEKVLTMDAAIREIASKYTGSEHLFFIGREIDRDLAVEASLKLKEISYIHSEAYAAGELKHGTISLITEGTPVVALTTVAAVCEKTISGIREVKARGAKVFSVCSASLAEQYKISADDQLILPKIREDFALFPAATALQMYAYYVSFLKGLDMDKPRNLAKSVTVE